MLKKIRKFNIDALPKPEFSLSKRINLNDSTKKLIIEIGCGVGFHPIQYAKSHPKQNIIAIEQTSEKFNKFKRRINRNQPLPNLAPLQAEASQWVGHYVKPNQVDKYFLLYPNPYPQKKMTNLRWANRPFMAHLIDTLKSFGLIVFRTNLEDYAQETKQMLKDYWKLDLLEDYQVRSNERPWTHFEKKYLERGFNCYHLKFSKPNFWAKSSIPLDT